MEEIFATSDALDAGLGPMLAEAGIPAVEVGENVIRALSETPSPQGAVAVAATTDVGLDSLPGELDLVLVLAEVRDPGNAGTLLRSAVAAGAQAVIFTAGSVDPFAPKTVRASAGTILRTTIVRGVSLDEAAATLRQRSILVLGTATRSGAAPDDVDLSRPVALVLGNESWGLPRDRRDLLDGLITIPVPGPVESLNAGIAGSIVLFEVVRQRRVDSGLRKPAL